MRALAACLVSLVAIFAPASQSRAAAINIVLSESYPGSGTWNLQLSTPTTSIGELAMLVSDSLVAFTPVDPRVEYQPPVCPLGCGAPVGFTPFDVTFSSPIAFQTTLLGFFAASDPISVPSVLSGDDIFGFTLVDSNFTAIPASDIAITVDFYVPRPGQEPDMPEPEVSASLLIALTGVTAVATRRRVT
ncbi:MAG: hypothetical protein ACHQ6T_10255 [Myxococcota bacterium]